MKFKILKGNNFVNTEDVKDNDILINESQLKFIEIGNGEDRVFKGDKLKTGDSFSVDHIQIERAFPYTKVIFQSGETETNFLGNEVPKLYIFYLFHFYQKGIELFPVNVSKKVFDSIQNFFNETFGGDAVIEIS